MGNYNKKIMFLFLVVIVFNFTLFCLSSYMVVEPYGLSKDKISPSKTIDFSSITKTDDSIVLDIKNSKIVKFADTNSMDPIIDKESTGILIPIGIKDVNIGDIVVYKYKSRNIVHRVIKKEEDDHGLFLITKGDNLNYNDPVRVRDNIIIGKIVGILY